MLIDVLTVDSAAVAQQLTVDHMLCVYFFMPAFSMPPPPPPQASLYGGLGTAAVLAACTQLSYQQFKEKKPASQPVTAVSLGVSAAVTVGMLHGCKAIGEHNKLAMAGAVLSTLFTGGCSRRHRG